MGVGGTVCPGGIDSRWFKNFGSKVNLSRYMAMTLESLLTRTKICRADEDRWFSSATLKNDLLVIGDTDSANFVRSCWLESMRVHIPNLEIHTVTRPTKRTWRLGDIEPRPETEPRLFD